MTTTTREQPEHSNSPAVLRQVIKRMQMAAMIEREAATQTGSRARGVVIELQFHDQGVTILATDPTGDPRFEDHIIERCAAAVVLALKDNAEPDNAEPSE